MSLPPDVSGKPGSPNENPAHQRLLDRIADLKASRSELAEANARNEATLNAAVDGIITIDARGTIEAANPAALTLFGYTADELIGENVKLLMPPPYRDEHDSYLEAYRKTGFKRIIGIGREVVGLRKDQSTFPMELSVGEAATEERVLFAGVIRDLSERTRAEDARSRLAAILENTLNEIFVFDATTLHFLLVNRKARENLGYSTAELEERTPVDIKPELSRVEFEKILEPLRNGERERLHFETVHERKDGTRYPVDVHLQRASAYGGAPAFVAMIFDMTERRRAQQALARSEKRAQEAEKLASIATLTAGIAHDVGTPMTVILGYAQMMEKAAENEKQRERARIISEQTRRVTDLVQTLLNISRPGKPKCVAIDLGQRVEHALDFFRERLRSRGVVVQRHFAEIPQIEGDPDRLEQVFLNLIVNAADAMPKGGTLTVRVESPETNRIRIRIADTGSGIPPEDLERIFEPFYTTKDRGEGNGLGLLVSQGIISEHDGTIGVTSELGVGTEFCIDLPCSSRSSRSSHPA